MKARDCQRLLDIAQQTQMRDRARLARHNAGLAAIAGARSALAGQNAREAADCAGGTSADLRTYGRWDRWAEGRTRALDAAAAKLGSERASALAALTRSFGQTRALEGLLQAARRAERQALTARAERNGQPPED